jgi:hypothetical protein
VSLSEQGVSPGGVRKIRELRRTRSPDGHFVTTTSTTFTASPSSVDGELKKEFKAILLLFFCFLS